MFMDTALVSGERWTGKMTSDPGSADTVPIGVTSLKSSAGGRETDILWKAWITVTFIITVTV